MAVYDRRSLVRERSSLVHFIRCSLITAVLTFGLAAIGVSAAAAQDQTGTLRVDVRAGVLPVQGATVSASGVSAVTDANGVVTLTLPAGSAFVTAAADGFEPATASVDIVAGAPRAIRLVITPNVPELGTLVASTRTRPRLEDHAVPVAVLDRDQIDGRLLKSPGDITRVFDLIPGVRVQTTSPELGLAGLRIRGLPGQYTRLLGDGVPLYFDRPSSHAPLRISPMDLGQIEVIKDVANGFFGSDAIGVINLQSQRPGAEPRREILFNQSVQGTTDATFLMSSPPKGSWSSAFVVGVHRQSEQDVDDDGWSDFPEYTRGIVGPRLFWSNGRGRAIDGVANVTFEKREGGSDVARQSLETKTADGFLSGQMILGNGMIVGGAGMLFVQSRDRRFSDVREPDRLQTATLELTLRRSSSRHTWLGGIAADWYALRQVDQPLPTTYVSTRPGIFFHDDMNVASWLRVSGSVRLDEHNLYGFLVSPRGSALVRGGPWSARVTGAQGYFTPRPLMDETDAAGLTRLTIVEPLDVETARNVSAEVSHRTRISTLAVTVFRTEIDDPAQIDRATYTLRNETEPLLSRGVELQGSVFRAAMSVSGHYTYLSTRERGIQELALTPRHSGRLIARVGGQRARVTFDLSYTGAQRLDANPYRTTSEPYTLYGLVGECGFGKLRVFVNADNLGDVRQTNWDPIARPSRDIDGRWTVDAWAPLTGRLISVGLRASF